MHAQILNLTRLLLSLLILPVALVAGDAVVVNANGTTEFKFTAMGPNILGTGAQQAITVATVLDTSAAGRFYVVSGTTNYAITLPSAALTQPGTMIGFIVLPPASATGLYTMQAAVGQTIDGQSSLLLSASNSLVVVSVGGNWLSLVKNLTDSPKYQGLNFTANSTWTVPIGVTSIRVRAWGGGGGANSTRGLSRGGNGGSIEAWMPVVPGETLSINVGAAGGWNSSAGTTSVSSTTPPTRVITVTGGARAENTDGANGKPSTVGCTFFDPNSHIPIDAISGSGVSGRFPGGGGVALRTTGNVGASGSRGHVIIEY